MDGHGLTIILNCTKSPPHTHTQLPCLCACVCVCMCVYVCVRVYMHAFYFLISTDGTGQCECVNFCVSVYVLYKSVCLFSTRAILGYTSVGVASFLNSYDKVGL